MINVGILPLYQKAIMATLTGGFVFFFKFHVKTDGDFSIHRSQGVVILSQDNWQNPKATWDNQHTLIMELDWHLDNPRLGDR